MNSQLRIQSCLIAKTPYVLSTVFLSDSEIEKLGGIQFESKIEKGQIICSVNKLINNFRHLQLNILFRFFKSPCCSSYGYKFTTSWNIAVRRILNS